MRQHSYANMKFLIACGVKVTFILKYLIDNYRIILSPGDNLLQFLEFLTLAFYLVALQSVASDHSTFFHYLTLFLENIF